MKIPEKFPVGCRFMTSFGGDEFVLFPDGGWFRLDEAALELVRLPGAPASKGTSSTEENFLYWADKARAKAASA